MTSFQHYDLGQVAEGSVVEIDVDSRVNVRLLDESNFRTYQGNRGRYQFLGGQAVRRPVRLRVPRAGHWHVALDLGGRGGQWRSSVNVRR
jgi:hypothetical protein